MKKYLPIHLTLLQLVILGTVWNILAYHIPFLHYVLEHTATYATTSRSLILLSSFTALISVTLLFFFILALLFGRFFRYILGLICIFNAIAVYFVSTYNVILDRTMMSNLFHTNVTESSSYYSVNILLYLLFLGLVPALFFIKFIHLKTPFRRIRLLLSGIISLILGVAILYANAPTWLWLDKYAKYMGGLSMPWSYTINTIRYHVRNTRLHRKTDKLPDFTFHTSQKTLVVLVIGESARAANFSLYGYKRETNPKLHQEDIYILPHAYTAATYTTAAIHAMLSPNGSTNDRYENLANYLSRGGVWVWWRSNNSGEPQLHVNLYQTAATIKKTCKEQHCEYDELLIDGLSEKLNKLTIPKAFVILHTAGSHGPTYTQKYPKDFEKFTPVCKSVDLKQCTYQTLINAYDNTILYTDYVLSHAIHELQKITDREVLMLYVSDHGESLGESGFYLHGTPFMMAPDFQKQIPYILWASNLYLKHHHLKHLKVQQHKQYNLKSVFQTIIGALDIDTPVYQKKYDILSVSPQ